MLAWQATRGTVEEIDPAHLPVVLKGLALAKRRGG
jgi:hypothetical protein